MQSEIDTLLDPAYEEREKQQHLRLLERVLNGLQAIEVAETDAAREAALAALPSATGEDAELDALLSQLKTSSIYVTDFGMTLKVAIGRAEYVRQLIAPTKLGTKLPFLNGDPGDGDATATPALAGADGDGGATTVRKVRKVRKVKKRRPPVGDAESDGSGSAS